MVVEPTDSSAETVRVWQFGMEVWPAGINVSRGNSMVKTYKQFHKASLTGQAKLQLDEPLFIVAVGPGLDCRHGKPTYYAVLEGIHPVSRRRILMRFAIAYLDASAPLLCGAEDMKRLSEYLKTLPIPVNLDGKVHLDETVESESSDSDELLALPNLPPLADMRNKQSHGKPKPTGKPAANVVGASGRSAHDGGPAGSDMEVDSGSKAPAASGQSQEVADLREQLAESRALLAQLSSRLPKVHEQKGDDHSSSDEDSDVETEMDIRSEFKESHSCAAASKTKKRGRPDTLAHLAAIKPSHKMMKVSK